MSLLKHQAIRSALEGNWEQAVKLNKKLVEENPEDVEALNRMALAYIILGKSDSAKTTYKKVLKIDPLNSIAIKSLKRIKPEDKNKKETTTNIIFQVNNTFLEETGKTKIVDLINLAQAELLLTLRTGQTVNMSVKRLKIFVLEEANNYIGVLPDDIGKRLIKFINGGNKYEAFIKSAKHNGVSIFIRELKKAGRFKDVPSFHNPLEKKAIKGKSRKVTSKDEEKIDEDQFVPEDES